MADGKHCNLFNITNKDENMDSMEVKNKKTVCAIFFKNKN